MTTEEKARAYDEALKDMRAIYPNLKGDAKLAVEHAFPELAESEDERIRKEIVEYFKHYSGGDNVSIKFPKWIAYLEKQKEIRDRYKVKNGDEPELTQFESELFSAGSLLWQTYMIGGEVNFCVWAKECSKDLLEAARKELEEKPAEWSEGDEVKLNDVIRIIENSGLVESIRNHYVKFLKSLRPSWKPSEEQMEALKISKEWEGLTHSEMKSLESLYEQLKKL